MRDCRVLGRHEPITDTAVQRWVLDRRQQHIQITAIGMGIEVELDVAELTDELRKRGIERQWCNWLLTQVRDYILHHPRYERSSIVLHYFVPLITGFGNNSCRQDLSAFAIEFEVDECPHPRQCCYVNIHFFGSLML
ncbi:hypothetical protein D3C86_695130 [compost metagenome]